MTPLAQWFGRHPLIGWLNRWRFVRWLWRWRWPGFPLTIVLALTLVQYIFPPDDHPWIDKGLVVGIAATSLLLIVVIMLGTQRPWSARSTGVLLLTVGDFLIHGILTLPAKFGWATPLPSLSVYYLRANIAIAIPVLILGWSDWFWDWMQMRRKTATRRGTAMREPFQSLLIWLVIIAALVVAAIVLHNHGVI